MKVTDRLRNRFLTAHSKNVLFLQCIILTKYLSLILYVQFGIVPKRIS